MRLQHLRHRPLHSHHPCSSFAPQLRAIRLEVLHPLGVGPCLRRLRCPPIYLRNASNFVSCSRHRGPPGSGGSSLYRRTLPPTATRSNLLPHRTPRRHSQRRVWSLGCLRARPHHARDSGPLPPQDLGLDRSLHWPELRCRVPHGRHHSVHHDPAHHLLSDPRHHDGRAQQPARSRPCPRCHQVGDDPHRRPSQLPHRHRRSHHARPRSCPRRDDRRHHGHRQPPRDQQEPLFPRLHSGQRHRQ